VRNGSAILLAVVSVGLTEAACAGELARQWLDRMHTALDQQTYEGTFVRITAGGPETLHVAHRYVDGALHERIVSLNGVGREVIRRDDNVHVIYPDQMVVRVDKVVASNPMVAALPSYSRTLEPHYELREFDTDRVAGRKVQIISISPRDEYRYGYLLWLDWETAMPLRSKSWNDLEHVIEDIFFTGIEYPDELPDSAFVQTLDTDGFAELRSIEPEEDELAPETPWTIEGLPAGFELTASMLKTMADSQHPVHHMVYSDGLATVSVFIDSPDAETDVAEGFYTLGSTNTYSVTRDGRKITAIGEVPRRTVEAFVTSLRAR
jgi:sigma-E factor negative regulatory protein RseB